MPMPPFIEPTIIANRRVLFAMAATEEYGPHLRELFVPLLTRVGPVEAALVVSEELARLRMLETLPELVVSLGSAGSRSLEQTEVYQATSVSYRDMDASALGFRKGETPFLDLPAVLDLPLRIPGVKTARLSTGANIVSGAAYGGIDADMVDMETYAVKRACMRAGVPMIALRGISDGATELRHVNDWTEYLHVIDEKLANAVRNLEQALGSGAIRLQPEI